jgi:VWFA-related protein
MLVTLGMTAQAGQTGAAAQQQQKTVAQQAIPDAPRPQVNLPLATVAPGQGTTSSNSVNDPAQGGATTAAVPAAVVSAPAASGAQAAGKVPDSEVDAAPGQGEAKLDTIRVRVNEVEIPFTVKDNKGHLVAGLTNRDVQVFENGVPQNILVFHDDPLKMAVAIVVDQSMSQDQMDKVNTSLGALQDAFTKYDKIAIFKYNKSVTKITDFTGAASARATQAIESSKGSGRDAMMAGSLSGPMAQTTVINNQNFDPNTSANRGHSSLDVSVPREYHPLNDAILAAATSLSTQPVDYRRVIYVISNGNEYGSKAKTSEVVKYLLTNGIEVDGTLVGDTSLWGLGTLDKLHLPGEMRDNVLVAYQKATGGQIDSEFREKSIEQSFARVAGEARNRYVLAYVTHEPFIDGKYRTTIVVVNGHGTDLSVLAKKGYYPAAMELRPRTTAPTQ